MTRAAAAAVAIVLLTAGSCSDDSPKAAPDEPSTTTTTTAPTTSTVPLDAVLERTQMIVEIDGPSPATPAAVTALVSAISTRFASAGIADARVVVVGGRIVVDVPPELEPLDLHAIAATTGALDLRPVLAALPRCPVDLPAPSADQPSVLRYREQGKGCARVGPAVRADVDEAAAVVPADRWVVAITLTPDGLAALNQLAAACFTLSSTCPTGSLAMVLDDVVQSAPTVQAATYDQPVVELSGEFDGMEAQRIASVLAAARLPSPVRVIEPPVAIKRRMLGSRSASGPGVAVLVRYGPDDDDVTTVLDEVGDALDTRLARLGATAAVLSADTQLGELTVVIVGAKDATAATDAVATAAGVEDTSRLVTTAALVP